MHYGTVIEFFPAKGYGFIRPDFGQDVFFHVSALGACEQRLQIESGQMVKYELIPPTDAKSQVQPQSKKETAPQPDDSGRPQARMVELIDALPVETFKIAVNKPQTARHPRARHKKPTWRR